MGLTQNTAQGADRDFVLSRHDGRIDGFADSPYELDMATLLTNFDESCCFKLSLHFPEGWGLSRANLQSIVRTLGGRVATDGSK